MVSLIGSLIFTGRCRCPLDVWP